MTRADDRTSSPPVVLPKGATGVRAWRRERVKRQKRRRRAAAVGVFLAVVAAAVLVWMQAPAGDRTSSSLGPANTVPAVGPLPCLLTVTGDGGAVAGIAALVPRPDGRGGTVLAIPPNTITEVVPGGQQALSTALATTPNAPGPDKMVATVENMLGISVRSIAVASFSQLGTLLSPAGTLHVVLSVPIKPANGSSGESFGPGAVAVAPGQVGDFLSDVSAAGPTEQASRLATLVQAWTIAIRAHPSASGFGSAGTTVASGGQASTTMAPPVTGASSLTTALTQLARGTTLVELLPVDEIPAESPGAPVEFQVDQKQLFTILPALVPGQPGALEPRPKVQLLNGTGGLGLDEEAMLALEPWVDVSLSGNACTPQATSSKFTCFGYGKTRIITYDARGRADAVRVARLLGTGEILTSTANSDIVDMTVIVGADFHVSG